MTKITQFLRWDVVFFKTHLLNFKKLCFIVPLWASYLIYCVYFSKHWPHDVIIFTKVLVHSLSWPLIGQLQIMSQFFLVEKADDLNSELKRDYFNGQYKLLTHRDTDSFNTTPPSQWGTASSDFRFKAQEIVLSWG